MAPSNRSTYLVVRPAGYHFRIKVPTDLRARLGKTEFRNSLASLNHRAALLEAIRLSTLAKEYFNYVRQNKQSGESIDVSNWRYRTTESEILAQHSQDEHIVPEPESPALSTLITAYSEEQVQTGNWAPKTEQENNAIYALFIRIIGDLACSDLSYSVLRNYKATLIRLPANLNKSPAYRDNTIAEILEMECRPMAVNNMNKNLGRISSLLRWGVKNGFIQINFAEGLQIKRNTRNDEERSGYTNEQLNQIFSHPLFTQCEYQHPFQYWLPLLGLYTGARLNELCQLYLNDVYIADDIWVISINADTADKKLKTLSAARVVPLHAELQRLGFLSYLADQKKIGVSRVFPELKQSRDGYGHKASKWFARFRRPLKLSNSQSKAPDFHSFRHNVSMLLRQNGYTLDEIGELLGHANTVVTARYAKRLTISQLSEIVESLAYPIRLRKR